MTTRARVSVRWLMSIAHACTFTASASKTAVCHYRTRSWSCYEHIGHRSIYAGCSQYHHAVSEWVDLNITIDQR